MVAVSIDAVNIGLNVLMLLTFLGGILILLSFFQERWAVVRLEERINGMEDRLRDLECQLQAEVMSRREGSSGTARTMWSE